MPVHENRYFELTYQDRPTKYLTLIGAANLDRALETGNHKAGLRLVREIDLDQIPYQPEPPAEPEPVAVHDQCAAIADLMRQNQMLAQAIDDLRQEINRRFQAQADHMDRIASEAIITPELRQGAA